MEIKIVKPIKFAFASSRQSRAYSPSDHHWLLYHVYARFKEARNSFYVEVGLVPSKRNPTRDQRAEVRGFQCASVSSCKQQFKADRQQMIVVAKKYICVATVHQ